MNNQKQKQTEDGICVLSTIKIFSYFSFVFSVMPKKGRVVENTESGVATFNIDNTVQKWYVRR